MKKLQVALLAITATSLLLAGCGKTEQSPVTGSDVVVETIVSEPLNETSAST